MLLTPQVVDNLKGFFLPSFKLTYIFRHAPFGNTAEMSSHLLYVLCTTYTLRNRDHMLVRIIVMSLFKT